MQVLQKPPAQMRSPSTPHRPFLKPKQDSLASSSHWATMVPPSGSGPPSSRAEPKLGTVGSLQAARHATSTNFQIDVLMAHSLC